MTGCALFIGGSGMTGLAAGFVLMLFMNRTALGGGTHVMAICTGRFLLNTFLAVRLRDISMECPTFVTIQASHAPFIVYIPYFAVPSCIFRINSSPVARESATGLIFISFLEAMIGKETLIDAGSDWHLDMTVPAGGMA